jgi:tryptophan-rich sensory protein
MKALPRVAVCIILCLTVGFVSSLSTANAIKSWYEHLEKSSLEPPSSVYAPVWTVLYVLMGIAAGIIWGFGLDSKRVRVAMLLFVVQLILNGLWAVVFFGMENPLLALAELSLLWIFILLTTISFMRINQTAGWLMVPYLCWVLFAGYLSFMIWYLN